MSDEDEREHDCCPRCGRGSCPGAGSGGWDDCEYPTWTATSQISTEDVDEPVTAKGPYRIRTEGDDRD